MLIFVLIIAALIIINYRIPWHHVKMQPLKTSTKPHIKIKFI